MTMKSDKEMFNEKVAGNLSQSNDLSATGFTENWGASLTRTINEDLSISQMIAESPIRDRNRMLLDAIDNGTISSADAESVSVYNERMRSSHVWDYDGLAAIAKNKYGMDVKTTEELDVEIAEEIKLVNKYTTDINSRATGMGMVGNFTGALHGGVLDPVNVAASLAIPGAGAGASLAKKVGMGVVGSLAAEAVIQPQTIAWKNKVGIQYTFGDAMTNMAFAAIVGGSLPAGVHGLGKLIDKAKSAKPKTTATPEVDDLDFSTKLDEAEAIDAAVEPLVQMKRELENAPQSEVLVPATNPDKIAGAGLYREMEYEILLDDGRPMDGFSLRLMDEDAEEMGMFDAAIMDDGRLRVDFTSLEEEFQGKGIGKQMYLDAIEFAKEKGITEITSDNQVSHQAQKVWKSLGATRNPNTVDAVKLAKEDYDLTSNGEPLYTLKIGKSDTPAAKAEPIEVKTTRIDRNHHGFDHGDDKYEIMKEESFGEWEVYLNDELQESYGSLKEAKEAISDNINGITEKAPTVEDLVRKIDETTDALQKTELKDIVDKTTEFEAKAMQQEIDEIETWNADMDATLADFDDDMLFGGFDDSGNPVRLGDMMESFDEFDTKISNAINCMGGR